MQARRPVKGALTIGKRFGVSMRGAPVRPVSRGARAVHPYRSSVAGLVT